VREALPLSCPRRNLKSSILLHPHSSSSILSHPHPSSSTLILLSVTPLSRSSSSSRLHYKLSVEIHAVDNPQRRFEYVPVVRRAWPCAAFNAILDKAFRRERNFIASTVAAYCVGGDCAHDLLDSFIDPTLFAAPRCFQSVSRSSLFPHPLLPSPSPAYPPSPLLHPLPSRLLPVSRGRWSRSHAIPRFRSSHVVDWAYGESHACKGWDCPLFSACILLDCVELTSDRDHRSLQSFYRELKVCRSRISSLVQLGMQSHLTAPSCCTVRYPFDVCTNDVRILVPISVAPVTT